MFRLDAREMESNLYREFLSLKQEIVRQMEITEKVTNQHKGTRKSYIEVENTAILKMQKDRTEKKYESGDGKDKNVSNMEVNSDALEKDVDISQNNPDDNADSSIKVENSNEDSNSSNGAKSKSEDGDKKSDGKKLTIHFLFSFYPNFNHSLFFQN